MDQKTKGTVMGILAIPLAAALLYGGYIVFTFKAKPRPPEPKIITFRADGKPKDSDAKGPKKKKSDEPQVWDVELIWEVENADEITIDQGIGKVEPKGSKHVEIDKNTTYVMKAKNISGEITNEFTVEVMPASQ
jgi:hypothetical protein